MDAQTSHVGRIAVRRGGAVAAAAAGWYQSTELHWTQEMQWDKLASHSEMDGRTLFGMDMKPSLCTTLKLIIRNNPFSAMLMFDAYWTQSLHHAVSLVYKL